MDSVKPIWYGLVVSDKVYRGVLNDCTVVAVKVLNLQNEDVDRRNACRLSITTDIAHGMAYPHHHCFLQVLHCDLKPRNALLDESMTARVLDFGTARLIFAGSVDSFATTNTLKGSVGYIAPEYGYGGRFSREIAMK
eukprot:Gb_08613 [translate_table: standard]